MESTPHTRFTELMALPDPAVDLGEAALLAAAVVGEYAELDVPSYLGRLDALGAEARARLDGHAVDGPQAASRLCRFLVDEAGFRGNSEDYYDPRNSFLNDVLDRRTGIPITLSTVFMEVGRRAGLTVEGVGLPGHFLVRVAGPAGGHLVDPFHGAAFLGPAD